LSFLKFLSCPRYLALTTFMLSCPAMHASVDFQLIKVSHLRGMCFIQPIVEKKLPPSVLQIGMELSNKKPFGLGTSNESLLELVFRMSKGSAQIRLGSSSGIEVQTDGSYKLHRGSFLFCHKNNHSWMIKTEENSILINGTGTWMTECLTSGLKVILLEGEITVQNGIKSKVLKSGDLVLVSAGTSMISKPMQIELPLLIGTSRLIKQFPQPLPSKSKLVSAAKVQALRIKKRYEAFVGDVKKDRKLQLWTPTSKTSLDKE